MIMKYKSYGECLGKAIEKVEEQFPEREITLISVNHDFLVSDMYTEERLARISILKDNLLFVSWTYYYKEG